MKVNILGIDIDEVSEPELLDKIKSFFDSEEKHYIVTPNPEIILKARKDEELKKILNYADIALPDGYGLICAAKFLNKPLKTRLTGIDLTLKICKEVSDKKHGVFFLGGLKGASKIITERIQDKFPELLISGSFDGRIDDTEDNDRIITSIINHSGAEILFVGLGAPKQEKWIFRNLDKLTNIKIAIGIGGGIDFISGKIRRAPLWMRRCGLEWLYRFQQEPVKRFSRIINATIIFPFKVLFAKIKKQD